MRSQAHKKTHTHAAPGARREASARADRLISRLFVPLHRLTLVVLALSSASHSAALPRHLRTPGPCSQYVSSPDPASSLVTLACLRVPAFQAHAPVLLEAGGKPWSTHGDNLTSGGERQCRCLQATPYLPSVCPDSSRDFGSERAKQRAAACQTARSETPDLRQAS